MPSVGVPFHADPMFETSDNEIIKGAILRLFFSYGRLKASFWEYFPDIADHFPVVARV